VVVRQHRLRDSVIEVMKLPYGDLAEGTAPGLESVDERGLRFAVSPPVDGAGASRSVDERTVAVLPWSAYEQQLSSSEKDADLYPGLFRGTWVNWGRAPYPPLDAVSATT
jgi:hypothetical protein